MKKATYVLVSKPLEIVKFKKGTAPIGWSRIDLLKRKLKDNKEYRKKFTIKELKQIRKIKR